MVDVFKLAANGANTAPPEAVSGKPFAVCVLEIPEVPKRINPLELTVKLLYLTPINQKSKTVLSTGELLLDLLNGINSSDPVILNRLAALLFVTA